MQSKAVAWGPGYISSILPVKPMQTLKGAQTQAGSDLRHVCGSMCRRLKQACDFSAGFCHFAAARIRWTHTPGRREALACRLPKLPGRHSDTCRRVCAGRDFRVARLGWAVHPEQAPKVLICSYRSAWVTRSRKTRLEKRHAHVGTPAWTWGSHRHWIPHLPRALPAAAILVTTSWEQRTPLLGPHWRQQPCARKVCVSNPGKPTCCIIRLRCAAWSSTSGRAESRWDRFASKLLRKCEHVLIRHWIHERHLPVRAGGTHYLVIVHWLQASPASSWNREGTLRAPCRRKLTLLLFLHVRLEWSFLRSMPRVPQGLSTARARP